MRQTAVQTEVEEATCLLVDSTATTSALAAFLPGISTAADAPVAIGAPGYRVRGDEYGWRSLLADPVLREQRRALLGYMKALRALNELAVKERCSLAEAAESLSDQLRRTLENAWVALLEQNRVREQAVRWCSLMFSNLQDSLPVCRGKVFAVNASAEELASDTGRAKLGDLLSKYYHRPDPREARGYVVVHGWVGGGEELKRLARVAHRHRAMLFADAPPYDDLETLRAASAPGGLLDSLPGEEVSLRHTVLFGNMGRARRRFIGKYAAEADDLWVPLAGPYFGMHLDNVLRGQPWKPAVGYRNAIGGIDGVKLDLRLQEAEGYSLFADHRINPGILLANSSERVVVWGPDALCNVDGGIQIGVADTELHMIRYAEWIVNKYGILDDLEKAEDVVGRKLTRFILDNSGANRMFRSGSRVQVSTNPEERCLVIDFQLYFREVAEKAQLRLRKPVDKKKGGNVEIKT